MLIFRKVNVVQITREHFYIFFVHKIALLFNPFLFIKNKWLFKYIYLQSFSALEKKRRYMFSEGNAAHPVVCDSPLQIAMTVWHIFFELLGWVW